MTRKTRSCGGAAHETRRPPTMTYEDVVFHNDPIHTRVLSRDPVVAEAEAEFYRAHQRIERQFAVTIHHLIEYGQYDGKSISKAADEIVGLNRGMDPAHFDQFRQFFVGINDYPGASALYSAAIPAIDLLVHGGSNMNDQERGRVRTSLGQGLYPQQPPYPALLPELLDGNGPKLKLSTDDSALIIGGLNRFRRVHRGNVRKFLPGVLKGAEDGSGGVGEVGRFLNEKFIATGDSRND